MNPPTLLQRGLSLWSIVTNTLDGARPLAALATRAYLAQAFFLSGLTKLRDWETTLLLFTEEYKVPLLTPQLAAISGTAGELVLPVLLLLGLAGRFSALGLSVVNVVAVLSLADIAPAALQQHITWGVLLATLALYGVGKWSIDALWLGPRLNRTAATGMALN
ncbi:DoxX family protein [Hydrogenophaga sp. PBL-H3]|uniref:DoxX family protein n=1 Tax=Hydrogenophaga sp. PBL-H3 TaxID=434010 RepID=UPI0013201FAF|nr:DoxX family protein [Hydrogenophaga sp. PBL-H3]QHE75454.1 DoxX family protein [Hydrogenophaga sp. PBL-H3]QHE79880.1 DoxX family protein [Hydrogenophaga sp. PBL-H3]